MAGKRAVAKRGGGAPRVSQAKLNLVLKRLEEGMSLRQACATRNAPTKSTVLKWVRNDPEFADQYARAREVGYALMADELIELSGTTMPFEEVVKDADGNIISRRIVDNHNIRRSMIETRKWMLSKMLPKVYGDKTENTHRFEDAKDITVTFVEAPPRPRAKLINGQYVDVAPEDWNGDDGQVF